MKLKIEYVNPADLVPADYNPREIGKEHLARLAKLLDSHGFVDPVIARRTDMLLLGGHQRIKANAMRDTPDTKVPAILLDDISDDQCKALNISLNNPKTQGVFDLPKLADLLMTITGDDFDLTAMTGFSEDELADLMEGKDGNVDDDEVPAVQDKAITCKGDVWILGDHRLLCGDCTKPKSMKTLMGGEKADMIFTDPPYGVSYNSATNTPMGSINTPSQCRMLCRWALTLMRLSSGPITVGPVTITRLAASMAVASSIRMINQMARLTASQVTSTPMLSRRRIRTEATR